jgi:hypothetical protein
MSSPDSGGLPWPTAARRRAPHGDAGAHASYPMSTPRTMRDESPAGEAPAHSWPGHFEWFDEEIAGAPGELILLDIPITNLGFSLAEDAEPDPEGGPA